MKNVDVGRSLAMDRRRQSQTWAPAGYRDQGDGSPSLLARLLDMFRGVDEEILMAESYLMSAETDDYYPSVANSESDAYIYAYNDGHSDGRANTVNYRPSTTDRELTAFKKIFKQAEEYSSSELEQMDEGSIQDVLFSIIQENDLEDEYCEMWELDDLNDVVEQYGYKDAIDAIMEIQIDDEFYCVRCKKDTMENDAMPAPGYVPNVGMVCVDCSTEDEVEAWNIAWNKIGVKN